MEQAQLRGVELLAPEVGRIDVVRVDQDGAIARHPKHGGRARARGSGANDRDVRMPHLRLLRRHPRVVWPVYVQDDGLRPNLAITLNHPSWTGKRMSRAYGRTAGVSTGKPLARSMR